MTFNLIFLWLKKYINWLVFICDLKSDKTSNMDVKQLWKFFDYKPFLNDSFGIVLDKIIYVAEKYLDEKSIFEIKRTADFAVKAHDWQFRLSGEPYIIHPFKVTEFLMEIKPDLPTIQASLLHDVIEDCKISEEEIFNQFGSEVLSLCIWLVKVAKIKYTWEDRHLETLKKTFLAMAKDLRVIFIKLADRIHNMQTLQYHPNPNKIIKIANETMKVFVPIAKRLWLYHYQIYLENSAFKFLYPDDFDRIFSYLKKYFWEWEKYTDRWSKMITNMLIKENIWDFVVKGRVKSPYRVFEKLEKRYHSEDLSNVMDLLAFRVVAKTISDCYMILGIIHKYYTPLIKKIKDYIAVPKLNGYQSIHTTVLGMFRFPVEIQIRTYDMDEIADYWVAAHFAYSEWNSSISEQQAQWVKRLQNLVETYKNLEDREEFKKELNIEVLDKRIFLYTPKWDVIELPIWSTVLDFAFAIHSNIWLSFKNAIVNGQIKPISYKLKTWDVIQINIFKNRYSASKHRLEFLHTSSAKNNLLKFIKMEHIDELIKKAIEELNWNLKDMKLPLFNSEFDKIHSFFPQEELEKKLISVLDKKETYKQLIKVVYPKEWKEYHAISKSHKKDIVQKRIIWSVIVDSDKLINYSLCNECNARFSEKIVAKTWKDGIKIHNINCKALKTISFDKLLEAHRYGEEINDYNLVIDAKILNDQKSFVSVMSSMSELWVKVLQVSLNSTLDSTSILTIETAAISPSKIMYLLNVLKRYWDSVQVIKKSIK